MRYILCVLCWGIRDVDGLDSIEVKDISLTDYIQTRHAVYLPHTAGRYAKKQFKKAQMPIVERLVDRCVIPYILIQYSGINAEI